MKYLLILIFILASVVVFSQDTTYEMKRFNIDGKTYLVSYQYDADSVKTIDKQIQRTDSIFYYKLEEYAASITIYDENGIWVGAFKEGFFYPPDPNIPLEDTTDEEQIRQLLKQ